MRAFRAILPAPLVFFVEVMAAQSMAVVIAVTGISSVGKDDVIVFIIANQVVTTWRARQRFSL